LEIATLRVLIVDDYEPWRRHIVSSLQKWPELQIAGEASDGPEAVQKSQLLQPDVILLDIGLPTMNGIEAARQIRQQSPSSKILCCSDHRSPEIAEAALQAGAEGYLVKSDAASDLLPAVISVIQGKPFVSRTLVGHVFTEPSDPDPVRDQRHVVRFYTDDEILLDELAALLRLRSLTRRIAANRWHSIR